MVTISRALPMGQANPPSSSQPPGKLDVTGLLSGETEALSCLVLSKVEYVYDVSILQDFRKILISGIL